METSSVPVVVLRMQNLQTSALAVADLYDYG